MMQLGQPLKYMTSESQVTGIRIKFVDKNVRVEGNLVVATKERPETIQSQLRRSFSM
jgi:hypothetical protein